MGMTNTTCTVHGPTCERIHVGDVVRVVTGTIGYLQLGNVTAIDGSLVTVNFPDGVSVEDDSLEYDIKYFEAELDKVSA
jgi:hypothetical protein